MAVQEVDYRKYGLIGTVLFHALLLILLIFAIFRGPDPPLEAGGSGVDLQYGIIGDEGFGDVQTTGPANDSKNTEQSRPAAEQPPQAQQQEAPTEKVEPTEEKLLTTEEESPVNLKSADVAEPKKETPREEVKTPQKAASVYTGKSKVDNGAGGSGTSNAPAGNNTGDKPGKVGDMGGPGGSMTGKVYTGNAGAGGPGPGGSGGGASLNMTGWRYDVTPKVDNTDESGRIVFRIKIDANGDIESVTRIESTVSPKVEKWYRDQIYKTTFSRTSSKTPQDQGATGTITIIIRAN